MNNIKLQKIVRTQPKNETAIHNTLKEIGKYILFSQGCRIIGTEIENMFGYDDNIRKSIMTCGLKPIDTKDKTKDVDTKELIEYNGQYYKVPKSRALPTINKHISDAVGIKIIHSKTKKENSNRYIYQTTYDVTSIEAKASLSDYKNGFCYGAERSYVIAPKGIIPIEYIHKDVGFIEVDMNNFKIIDSKKGFEFQGIEIIRKAKKRLDSRFKNKDTYQEWASELVIGVSKRCTNDLLFWKNSIPLYKWVR